MARLPVGRNGDSRTRLLNSLGLFQEQRDERKCMLGKSSASIRYDRDSSPSNNHFENIVGGSDGESGEKKKFRHVRSWSDIPVRSALHNSVAFETRLNDENIMRNHKDDRGNSQRRSSLSRKNKEDNSPHSVRFNTVVSGVKIPSRNQYSRRIKQTLWRDRYELSEMVERNTTEFHAENYDWKQVVLDEEMYVDATSGERIHPCHVELNSFDESDDDDYNDSLVDESGFAPLSRLDSIASSK